MTTDSFKPGDAVRIISARAWPHLQGTKALITKARAWVNAKARDGEKYQIFAYQIAACDGRTYSAEEYTLERWRDDNKAWVDKQRSEKISVEEFSRAVKWKPKMRLSVQEWARRNGGAT